MYPLGVPFLLLVSLWRNRDRFNPLRINAKGMVRTEAEVIAQRKEDAVLAKDPVASFAMIYRPQYYMFDVYNMVRRLLLTCAVLVCRTLAETTVFVVFVAIVTLVIEQETKPYINAFISAFTHVCWYVKGPAFGNRRLYQLPPLPTAGRSCSSFFTCSYWTLISPAAAR